MQKYIYKLKIPRDMTAASISFLSTVKPDATTYATKPALTRLGRFAVTRELGRGRLGCVYLGQDPVIGRAVALKTLNPELNQFEKNCYSQEFINEARAAGSLSHPNIVTIYDACHENGTVYVAMEYLNGAELSHLLEQGQSFSTDEVASIAWKIADALSHAHQRQVIHRDIKPANIFMVGNNQPKLVDFGIARFPTRLKDGAIEPDSPATIWSGAGILGTPNYMSPEQALGNPVDARTDIYSLGAVMYEMLTGIKPFQADDVQALMERITTRSPIPPDKLNPGIPPRLSEIVMRAMSRNLDKRYASAEKMAIDIKRFLLKERRDQRRMSLPIDTLQPRQGDDISPYRLKRFWLGYLAIAAAAVIAVYGLLH